MTVNLIQQKRQAHAMLEHLTPEQLSVVRDLLEVLLDPLSRKLAAAPYDDEPISAEEKETAAASRAWFDEHGQGIPHEEIWAEFSFTPEELSGVPDKADADGAPH